MLRFAAMSQDPRLEPALRALWPGRAAIAIPIEEGITNRNYVVELDDADEDDGYVLRLSGANTELLGIDRNDEVEAGRAAAAVGVGPEVVAASGDAWIAAGGARRSPVHPATVRRACAHASPIKATAPRGRGLG
jgi:hypothetical protein